MRGAWVEIFQTIVLCSFSLPHPVRGAWVEIGFGVVGVPEGIAAPREGCVG